MDDEHIETHKTLAVFFGNISEEILRHFILRISIDMVVFFFLMSLYELGIKL